MSSSRDDFGIAFRSALLQRGAAQKFSLVSLIIIAKKTSMDGETKYVALEKFLMDKTENITLTFVEINEIIGEKLPVPSDSAVFKAGYKVEKIDFKTKSVIFSKID